ncbi:MAG: ribosome biogenesis GTPase Der [Anaerolineae bacterium]
MARPLVAIVGRPNVGKSTLFNRLVGSRMAIVEDVPGTTRDRLYATAEWGGREFDVVDTGGLELDRSGAISERVRNQASVAVDEADVIVLLTDGATGLAPADYDVAELLRRSGKPLVLAVNKSESRQRQMGAGEFWALGLGEPFAVSALHGTGTGELLDAVVDALPEQSAAPEPDALRVAIVGRPNVGKSSLLNRLLGSERMIVSPEPGTTRDAVDQRVTRGGQEYVLVDTAGIRRRGRIEPGIERYSVMRAMRAIERSDVAVLLLDATEAVAAQDAHVGGFIEQAGCGAVIAVNKWDLVEKDTYTIVEHTRRLRSELSFLQYAPVVFISALTGQRAGKVLEAADAVEGTRSFRVPTADINRLVADLQVRHDLRRKGRPLKIKYATQVDVAPPRFVFFVNDKSLVHFSHERYIENQLRTMFGFEGTPLRLHFRESRGRGTEDGKADG